MALQIFPALLLVFTVSAAFGDDISEQNTELTVEAVRIQDHIAAIYSSPDDPRLKCLTAWLTVYEPEKLFAIYRFHYRGQNGEPGIDIDYCVNMTATESNKFGFSPCKEGAISSAAQGYYFNGEDCFIGRYPLLGNDYCFLWAKPVVKDSVPEQCVAQFDENCGPERYTLYDKEQCSYPNRD